MPRGIAIDWVAGNVYWTDSGRDVIEVAQMKGENRKTLISGMIDEPHAIVVDPLRGWARVLGGGVWAGVIHRGQRPQASRLLGPWSSSSHCWGLPIEWLPSGWLSHAAKIWVPLLGGSSAPLDATGLAYGS